LVIVIVAIVSHLYQDNGNVFFFDELWLVASPTHSKSLSLHTITPKTSAKKQLLVWLERSDFVQPLKELLQRLSLRYWRENGNEKK